MSGLVSVQRFFEYVMALSNEFFLPRRKTLMHLLEEIDETRWQVARRFEAGRRRIQMKTNTFTSNDVRNCHAITSKFDRGLDAG